MDYRTELDAIKRKYDGLKIEYFSRKGKHEQLLEQKSSMQDTLVKTAENIDLIDKVRILIQKVSEFAREQSRRQIEELVTNCLQYIFDTDLEFKIEIDEVRGRPEAEFFVISNVNGDVIKTRPQEARGGGIVDVISLAIRFAVLQCSNIEVSGPIILDEPAKHVSEEYIIRVGDFLKQLSELFDRQIIMVTHNKHLSEIADKWFRIEMKNGVSRVDTFSGMA